MDVGTAVVVLSAVGLVIFSCFQGLDSFQAGWKQTWRSGVALFPILGSVLVIVGFSEVLVPRAWISGALGHDSGIRGIFIASGVGALLPGGPFVVFPLAGAMLGAKAGIGPIVALVSAWAVWSIPRIPLEMSFLGPQATLARLASTVFVPPLAGWIVSRWFEGGAS